MNDLSVAKFDSRILKTEYRNYDLLARYWNGEYRGRIWKNKKIITDYEGDNLDIIFDNLQSIVDQLIIKKIEERKNKTVTTNEFLDGFREIMPKVTDEQRQMLAAHAKSPERTASLETLRQIGEYSTLAVTAAQYEKISKRLCDELAMGDESTHDVSDIMFDKPNDQLNGDNNCLLTLKQEVADSFLQALSGA